MRRAFFALAACFAMASKAANFGVPFQAHTPEGNSYWVVLCIYGDECYEYAYQFCQGPYVPLDKQFLPASGFRFVCKPTSKRPEKSTPPK